MSGTAAQASRSGMIGDLVARGLRFSLVGAICTLAGYVLFVALSRVVHYQLANVGVWAFGLVLGFLLNRAFTYRLRGRERMPQQFGLFMAGTLCQLAISAIGYAVLIDGLHLSPTPAFVLNLPFTAGFMFLYLELVAFRRRTAVGQ